MSDSRRIGTQLMRKGVGTSSRSPLLYQYHQCPSMPAWAPIPSRTKGKSIKWKDINPGKNPKHTKAKAEAPCQTCNGHVSNNPHSFAYQQAANQCGERSIRRQRSLSPDDASDVLSIKDEYYRQMRNSRSNSPDGSSHHLRERQRSQSRSLSSPQQIDLVYPVTSVQHFKPLTHVRRKVKSTNALHDPQFTDSKNHYRTHSRESANGGRKRSGSSHRDSPNQREGNVHQPGTMDISRRTSFTRQSRDVMQRSSSNKRLRDTFEAGGQKHKVSSNSSVRSFKSCHWIDNKNAQGGKAAQLLSIRGLRFYSASLLPWPAITSVRPQVVVQDLSWVTVNRPQKTFINQYTSAAPLQRNNNLIHNKPPVTGIMSHTSASYNYNRNKPKKKVSFQCTSSLNERTNLTVRGSGVGRRYVDGSSSIDHNRNKTEKYINDYSVRETSDRRSRDENYGANYSQSHHRMMNQSDLLESDNDEDDGAGDQMLFAKINNSHQLKSSFQPFVDHHIAHRSQPSQTSAGNFRESTMYRKNQNSESPPLPRCPRGSSRMHDYQLTPRELQRRSNDSPTSMESSSRQSFKDAIPNFTSSNSSREASSRLWLSFPEEELDYVSPSIRSLHKGRSSGSTTLSHQRPTQNNAYQRREVYDHQQNTYQRKEYAKSPDNSSDDYTEELQNYIYSPVHTVQTKRWAVDNEDHTDDEFQDRRYRRQK